MRNVIILGAGGCAAEVTFYIEDHNSKVSEGERINILGHIDYAYNTKDYYDKYNFKAPVLFEYPGTHFSPLPIGIQVFFGHRYHEHSYVHCRGLQFLC